MATTSPQITTVGSFTYDAATSTITGPAEFMASDDYADVIAGTKAGTNHTFRAGVTHSPTVEVALLVTIQTAYAGWHGMETFNRMRAVSA